MTTAYISHPSSVKHELSPTHPESPSRLWAINDALIGHRLMELVTPFVAKPATKEQLYAAHDPDYVDYIFEVAPGEGGTQPLDADTTMNEHSLEAALYAAGANVMAVDKVMTGEVSNAFCAVRPPGHHAERNRAMGFCLFNNVAVGAYHALNVHKLNRIAIVDFDVHHGNGTEDIFKNEERVMFCSSYQHPFYPYSGGPNQDNHLLNIPLDAGCKSEDYRNIMASQCFPALAKFKPELLMISAGFDAHAADPLASLMLLDDDFAWISKALVDIANRHCGGKIISTLEGGYDLNALGRSVAAHVKELIPY